jgi:ElaB/YqjD/DUF883 family membrane-anchored ribosome-binding protein
MAFASRHLDKVESLESQIARLRQQVESLMTDRVNPVVTDFATRTQRTWGEATAGIQKPTRSMSRTVMQRPWIAVLIAATVGWVLYRVTR